MVTKLYLDPLIGLEDRPAASNAALLFQDKSSDRWWFTVDKSDYFEVFVDYEDVEFKFECFGLRLKRGNAAELATLNARTHSTAFEVKFHFRAEWKISSISNEEAASKRPFTRFTGSVNEIPISCSAACIFLAGISWSDRESKSDHLLYFDVDDSNPTALKHCLNHENPDMKIFRFDQVNFDDLNSVETWFRRWQQDIAVNLK